MKTFLKILIGIVIGSSIVFAFLLWNDHLEYGWSYNRGLSDREHGYSPMNGESTPQRREAYWKGYGDGKPDPRNKKEYWDK